jgi:hypothetical protein
MMRPILAETAALKSIAAHLPAFLCRVGISGSFARCFNIEIWEQKLIVDIKGMNG